MMKVVRSSIFAQRVKARREQLGMTQRDLADACGLTPVAICHFEAGRREPALFNAVRIAKGLGVSLDSLACETSLEDRVSALEQRVASLDSRTVGSITFGGPRR